MKTVVIVGGSSGIGLETVKVFLRNSCEVLVVDRNPVPDSIKDAVAAFIRMDLLQQAEVENIASSLPAGIKIDHLVITAGGATASEIDIIRDDKEFWNLDALSITDTINLNLINQILLIKALVNSFSADSNKSITLTSSINSMGRYGLVAYSTAKSGLEGFVRSAAEDLGKLSIRINCVVPGSTRTPLTISEGMDFESVKKQTILNRVNEPEDLAETIYMLASSRAITGQSLICDSGQSLASSKRY